jgi:hypothetical protein
MSPSTAQPQPAAAMELQQQPPVQADQPRVHQGMGTSQGLLLPPQSWPRPADLYRPHEAARRDRDEPARRRRRRHVPRPLLLLHPVPDTVQLLHHPSVRGCACSLYDGGGCLFPGGTCHLLGISFSVLLDLELRIGLFGTLECRYMTNTVIFWLLGCVAKVSARCRPRWRPACSYSFGDYHVRRVDFADARLGGIVSSDKVGRVRMRHVSLCFCTYESSNSGGANRSIILV